MTSTDPSDYTTRLEEVSDFYPVIGTMFHTGLPCKICDTVKIFWNYTNIFKSPKKPTILVIRGDLPDMPEMENKQIYLVLNGG